MAVRVDALHKQMQNITANRFNMGTEKANAGLEQIREQLAQAVQAQEDLNRAAKSMDISAANAAYIRLEQAVGNTERQIRDNTDQQGRFNQEIQKGTGHADRLMQMIKRAVAAYATMQTLSKAASLSDQLTSTSARLEMVLEEVGSLNGGLKSVQDVQDMIFASAERARGSYQATADAVSKLGLMAGNAFSGTEEIVAFMEQVNKQFRIAGTESSGIQAAMLQLTQAMGSGVLRGEEYNSILEQAPNIIQNIAKYIEGNEDVLKSVAQSMKMDVDDLAGNVQEKLKDIAGEGLLSAGLVKAAMFAAADETNEKFERMPKTFGQIWDSFQNNALVAFQPILQRMNDVANSAAFQEFTDGALSALTMFAGAAVEIFDLLIRSGSFVADNWDDIAPVLFGVAVAAGVLAGALGVQAAASWIATAAHEGLMASLMADPLTWIVVAIGAVAAGLYRWVQACGGASAAWLTLKDYTLTAWDEIQIGFMEGVFFVGNMMDLMHEKSVSAGTMIANAMGDMNVKCLTHIENMVNGAISLLNQFITAVNNIPGVAIPTIDSVTFAAAAAARNEAAKSARTSELSALEAANERREITRERRLESMKRQAAQGKMERLAGIAAAKSAAEDSGSKGQTGSDFEALMKGAAAPVPMRNDGDRDIGKVGSVGNVKNVEGEISLADEDVKLYRDLAERRYMNRIELKTLAPNINVTVPAGSGGNLEAQDVADYLRKMLIEQMSAHTAMSHG